MYAWSEMLLKARRRTVKTLEYYMGLPYRLEIVPDEAEGGYVASYPELRGCLTTG